MLDGSMYQVDLIECDAGLAKNLTYMAIQIVVNYIYFVWFFSGYQTNITIVGK